MATRQSGTKAAPTQKTTLKKAPVKKPATKVTLRKKLTGVSASTGQVTDGPILPIDQLERLYAIKPDAVDWVIQQTQIEAEHRREETSRVNSFIFIEHLLGQFSALLIGAAGILGGSWVATSGQPWAGVTIAAAVITGLAVAYLKGKTKRVA